MWFLFSILTATFESLKDVSSKKGIKKADEYFVSWSLRFFSFLFLAPILFFTDIPPLGKPFFLALFTAGLIDSITTILYMKAIKGSDLSLSVPMLTFTPIFLLITSPIMINEFPNFLGILGVLLIVLGSYILNFKEKRRGYLKPFKILLKENGPKLMLIVAFIWGISSNIDKIGIRYSSPIFWAIAINLIITCFIFPVMLFKSKYNINEFKKNLKLMIPIGFFSALSVIFQMMAINIAFVPYVISIKRTSVIISVILGILIFRERGLKEKLSGTLIMMIGVFLIGLS